MYPREHLPCGQTSCGPHTRNLNQTLVPPKLPLFEEGSALDPPSTETVYTFFHSASPFQRRLRRSPRLASATRRLRRNPSDCSAVTPRRTTRKLPKASERDGSAVARSASANTRARALRYRASLRRLRRSPLPLSSLPLAALRKALKILRTEQPLSPPQKKEKPLSTGRAPGATSYSTTTTLPSTPHLPHPPVTPTLAPPSPAR